MKLLKLISTSVIPSFGIGAGIMGFYVVTELVSISRYGSALSVAGTSTYVIGMSLKTTFDKSKIE